MKVAPIALALLAALSIPNSRASEVSTSVTMSNFRIELIDLDPSDGITPQFAFLWPVGSTSPIADSQVIDGSTSPFTKIDSFQYGSSLFGSASSSAATATASAKSSISGDGTLGGTVLHAEASIPQYRSTDSFTTLATLFSSFDAFRLTAHTAAVLTADVQLDLVVPEGSACCYSEASLSFGDPTGGNQFPVTGAGIQRVDTSHDMLTLQTEISNLKDETQIVDLSASVQAGTVAPVPEPSTSALLLAGLVAIGWARRRSAPAQASLRV